MDKLKILLGRIVKNIINDENICKTDTEKAIDAGNKQPMSTNKLPPTNIVPKKRKVLAVGKDR